MIFAAAVVIIPSQMPTSYADDVNPGVYSGDSQPFGISHGEWTAIWWEWFVGIPAAQTPAEDTTGERCMINQNDPNVWFLTGTFGGNAERNCTIPYGSAVLVPIIAAACSEIEYPELKAEAELRQCAVSTNKPNDIGASLDGVEVKEIWSYGVESPLFNLTYPEDNISGVVSGPSPAVSHFYSLFLEPLSVGQHEIVFHQLTLDDPVTGIAGFAYRVTYQLDVVERNFNNITEQIMLGNQSSTITINSSSAVTDFSFSELDRNISFVVSESSPQGIVEVPVESVLRGPYVVMVDENPVTNPRLSSDSTTGSNIIKLAYPSGNHEITIVGTSVVPEFGTVSIILLALLISAVVGTMSVLGRRST